MNAELADRLAVIDAQIAEAAVAVERDPSEITRIVVTKFQPASLIADLFALGVRDVGENRPQELAAKASGLAALDGLRWHFVGQAQTNKARQIRRDASVVHSLDRVRLAAALDAAASAETGVCDVLLQVDLSGEPGRGGVLPADLEALASDALSRPSLRVRGVMAVAPLGEKPAQAFERLRAAADRLRALAPEATWISAGMSGDFADAIAMGATHLRIGSAITGPRLLPG